MRCVAFVLVILGLSSAAAMAATDEEAFKARVAECQNERCLGSVSSVYSLLKEEIRYLADSSTIPVAKKRLELEVPYLRNQLNDAEFFRIWEDGRWYAMTEAQKQDWTTKRWGPRPNK